MDDLTFEKLRDIVARFRRSQLHIAGTREEEDTRKVLEAAVNGAPLVVLPELESGDVVLVDGKVLFHSEAERELFVSKLVEASETFSRGAR